MAEEKEKFKTYIQNLTQDLIEANSGFILYKKLIQDAPKRFETYNVAPTFFQLTIRSFYMRSVILVCRFFDSNDDSLSLKRILGYAQANVEKIFAEEKKNEILKEIQRDMEAIDGFADIKSLKEHRDKRFAHLDKRFVDGKEDFASKYPLEDKDFDSCIKFVDEILNKYHGFFSDRTYVHEYISGDGELDVMLDYLERYELIRKDAFDGKIEGLKTENWEVLEKYF